MRITALAALCLLSTFSNAQSKKFTFKLGEDYELPKRTEDLSFFGNNKDGIVNLSLKKEELHVIRFDAKNLKLTSDKIIDLPEATKNFNSEEVVDFASNYYWLHSDWDKGSETETLYYDQIDVATGKLSVTNKKLLESSRIAGDLASGGFYQMKTVGKYKFNYDAQKKKLLISYRLKPSERNDKLNYDQIGLNVFDENMTKVWGGEFTMPYTEAVMDNSDFSIDAAGNAYMLAKVYDSDARKEKDKSTGKPAYHYEVFKFSKDNKKPTIATILVDDFFIGEATLIENSLNEMVIACTYSKKVKSNGTDGVFLAMLDQNGKVEKFKQGYYEFPLAELQKFETARKQRKMEKKDDYEAPNLKVRNVLVEADGSVLIACEEYYFVVSSSSSSMPIGGGLSYSRNNITYYNEDILAAKINAAGKMEWVRKIPKKQRGAVPVGTMSFKLISDASGYYFLYLDNVKNMDLAEDEQPKYHIDGYGGQVIVSKIDNTGKLSKDLLFDTRDEEVMVFPAKFTKINGNQFIGRAKLKKTVYQPLLITVNQ